MEDLAALRVHPLQAVGLGSVKAFVLLAAMCSLSCNVGCGSRFDAEGAIERANATNAQRLASVYQFYQRTNSGRGPKDKAKLRDFTENMSPVLLERMEINPSDLDNLFISDRDEQPYEIRYGVRGSDRSPAIAIVFEKEGVDGKRLVAFTQMLTKEIEDDFEYDQLLSGKLDGQEAVE